MTSASTAASSSLDSAEDRVLAEHGDVGHLTPSIVGVVLELLHLVHHMVERVVHVIE